MNIKSKYPGRHRCGLTDAQIKALAVAVEDDLVQWHDPRQVCGVQHARKHTIEGLQERGLLTVFVYQSELWYNPTTAAAALIDDIIKPVAQPVGEVA